jgi:hypothetical protein
MRKMPSLMCAVGTFATSVHNRLARTPVSCIYKAAFAKFQRLQNEASYLAWRATRSKPSLNRESVLQFIPPTISTNKGVIQGRLLARVAFYFRRQRLKYLVEVTEQLRLLPFSDVVIGVDTNSAAAQNLIRNFCAVDEITVHSNLKTPLGLVWTNRAAMKSSFPAFDYFLYIEDDMLLTPAAVSIWHERLPVLTKRGFLPGFLRVEHNRRGELVASDFQHPDTRDSVLIIDDKPYLHTKFPYQALWLYDKETMRAFMSSGTFENGNPRDAHKPLENSALGFTFEPTGQGYRSRYLLPLTSSIQIDPRCYVYHMPSNYGRRFAPHPANLGTHSVDYLIAPAEENAR